MERIWQNLWKRKKKKFSRASDPKEEENKKNDCPAGDRGEDEVERIIIKSSVLGESKTFPRSFAVKPEDESSPALPRLKRDPVAASAVSLRGRRFEDPYDRNKWTSTQHFHVPLGTRPRHASSKGGLSIGSANTSSRRNLRRPQSSLSLRCPTPGPAIESHNNLRRAVEPYDKIKDQASLHHFHLPAGQRRLTYNRAGKTGGMTRLVNNIQSSSLPAQRQESEDSNINNEEPIQLAQYPGGLPDSKLEDLPAIFPFSDQERKRRRSGSLVSSLNKDDEQLTEADGDDKMRRHEETLTKLPSGIGRVFLDTIRKTETIRNAKVQQIDPRSAARTPAANKVPKYRLRYDSPAWASPSRDTFHGRPWDSEEDLCRQVVLTSSGCASGCASDHLPHAKSVTNLGRSVPSLHSTLIRPGYTHLTHINTLPHIRTVSGRILSPDCGGEVEEGGGPTTTVNSHSGVVSSVNNSFSWHSLAKYQEETLNKPASKRTFFKKPELKHKRTLLDI